MPSVVEEFEDLRQSRRAEFVGLVEDGVVRPLQQESRAVGRLLAKLPCAALSTAVSLPAWMISTGTFTLVACSTALLPAFDAATSHACVGPPRRAVGYLSYASWTRHSRAELCVMSLVSAARYGRCPSA